jgi:DNA-binding NtrC family response regulator
VRPEHLPARIQEALATESAPTVIIDKPEGSSRATIPVQFRPIAIEVRDLEIQRINEALEAAEGNKTKAAALIGMPIRTFTEKMKHYGIARDAPPRSSR